MVKRGGFVSNSSSSSFIISLKDLSGEQLHKILNIDTPEFKEDPWSIRVEDGDVIGYTSMDNFDMDEYLKNIGVDEDKVEWRHY